MRRASGATLVIAIIGALLLAGARGMRRRGRRVVVGHDGRRDGRRACHHRVGGARGVRGVLRHAGLRRARRTAPELGQGRRGRCCVGAERLGARTPRTRSRPSASSPTGRRRRSATTSRCIADAYAKIAEALRGRQPRGRRDSGARGAARRFRGAARRAHWSRRSARSDRSRSLPQFTMAVAAMRPCSMSRRDAVALSQPRGATSSSSDQPPFATTRGTPSHSAAIDERRGGAATRRPRPRGRPQERRAPPRRRPARCPRGTPRSRY